MARGRKWKLVGCDRKNWECVLYKATQQITTLFRNKKSVLTAEFSRDTEYEPIQICHIYSQSMLISPKAMVFPN